MSIIVPRPDLKEGVRTSSPSSLNVMVKTATGLTSDVESDDYSESARSYELGKASDFACARPRPDFSAFLCLWRKVTIGWEMRPVRLVLQNIRNFFRKTDGASLLLKIVGPVRAAIRRKVQVRKVREKPGGRLFTTFTDVLRPLTSLGWSMWYCILSCRMGSIDSHQF